MKSLSKIVFVATILLSGIYVIEGMESEKQNEGHEENFDEVQDTNQMPE